MKKLLFMLFLLLPNTVFACQTWGNKPDSPDYKYFVGRGYSEKESESILAAHNDIDKQISRMFGVKFQSNSDYYSDLDNVASTTRSTEGLMNDIQIKDFEEVSTCTEKDNNEYKTYILVKYSKAEIEKEKSRLKNVKKEPKKEIIDNQKDNCVSVPVTIKTDVKGAHIFVNGIRVYNGYGELNTTMCKGEYTLSIDAIGYKSIKEQLIISEKKELEYKLPLNKKLTFIHVDTDEQIDVIINGKCHPNGSFYEFQMNKTYKIIIKGLNINTKEVTEKFDGFVPESLKYNVTTKPMVLDFRNLREPVDILVNGEKITDLRINVNFDSDILFSRKGYYNKHKRVIYKPGQTEYIGNPNLMEI